MAVALPFIAVAATIAGTAVSTVGLINQANAQSAAQNYQAQVSAQNAQIARAETIENQRKFQIYSEQQLGAETAGYGASGTEGGVGSSQSVLENSARQSSYDMMQIQYQGQLKGLGYSETSTLQSMEASSTQTGGYFSAAGTLLSGSAKAAYYGLPGGTNNSIDNGNGGGNAGYYAVSGLS